MAPPKNTTMIKTPNPPVELPELIPAFAKLAKETVRLHPRRGDEPAVDGSKIGGMFLWPAGEPWPKCPEHGDHLVGVIQLRAADVPGVAFPENVDLMQLLWCAADYEEFAFNPVYRVFWRNSKEIGERAEENPRPARTDEEIMPKPCVLSPERVVEYPSVFELAEELEEQVEGCAELAGLSEDEEPIEAYQYLLSVADGTKAGGHVNWVQEVETPECECGRPMEHLLTLSTAEFDAATRHRWCPKADGDVWEADYDERMQVQCPAGWMLGDMGAVFFFVCRDCEGWPVKSVFQCS